MYVRDKKKKMGAKSKFYRKNGMIFLKFAVLLEHYYSD